MTWACRDGFDGAATELHHEKPASVTDDNGDVRYFGNGPHCDVPDWVLGSLVVKPGECVEVSVICGPMPHVTIMVPKELPTRSVKQSSERT